MKFTSWPKPPIGKERRIGFTEKTLEMREAPEIPEKFVLFGLNYTVVDGNPRIEIPAKPLDRLHASQCISRSISLFVKTLKRREGTALNEIRDLHIEINEEINRAKAFEAKDKNSREIILQAKNKKNEMKNEILSQILHEYKL